MQREGCLWTPPGPNHWRIQWVFLVFLGIPNFFMHYIYSTLAFLYLANKIFLSFFSLSLYSFFHLGSILARLPEVFYFVVPTNENLIIYLQTTCTCHQILVQIISYFQTYFQDKSEYAHDNMYNKLFFSCE